MDMLEEEIPPVPGSATVVQEKPPAKQKGLPPRKRKNGQLNSFAKSMLSKKQQPPQQEAPEQDPTPPANSTEDEPDAMEVDSQPVAMESSSSSSSSSSDSAVEDAEPEGQPLQPAKSPRRQTVRLPRNKSLYAMRDLQRSSRPIFKNLTFHRIVKTYTREVLKRNDVKYSKQAMGALMRIIETMLYEQLLKAQAFCLNAGRKTLMLHHVETAQHHGAQPNLGQWTVEDFEQEEGRLEPSRFPRSRLSQTD